MLLQNATKLENVLLLVLGALARLARFRALLAIACAALTLCASTIASAKVDAPTKTRVWDFDVARIESISPPEQLTLELRPGFYRLELRPCVRPTPLWSWPGQNPYKWRDPSGRMISTPQQTQDDLQLYGAASAWLFQNAASQFSSGAYASAALDFAAGVATGIAWFSAIPNPLGGAGAVLGPAGVGAQLGGCAARGAGDNAAETLSRLGTSRESAARLGRKAEEAEKVLGIHGVSASAGAPRGQASQAARGAVEGHFPVHNTPTRADPLHRTVELPKPVTQQVADLFNSIFGRSM